MLIKSEWNNRPLSTKLLCMNDCNITFGIFLEEFFLNPIWRILIKKKSKDPERIEPRGLKRGGGGKRERYKKKAQQQRVEYLEMSKQIHSYHCLSPSMPSWLRYSAHFIHFYDICFECLHKKLQMKMKFSKEMIFLLFFRRISFAEVVDAQWMKSLPLKSKEE